MNMGVGGTYAYGKYMLTSPNLFSENQQVELTITQSINFNPSQTRRRLQSEGQTVQSDFRAHANIGQTGVQMTLTSDNKIGFSIEPVALANYLISTEPEARRLLEEISSNNEESNDTGSIQELQENLTKFFNEELQTNHSIQFKPVQNVELKFNPETLKFEVANGTEVKNNTRLLLVRLLSWKKFWKGFGRALNKVVIPVVNVVRKSAAAIGMIGGTIIGGVLAGPAGAAIGFMVGSALGTTAQALVTACVPKDTLNFKCTKDQAEKVNAGVSVTIGGDCQLKACGTFTTFDSPPVPYQKP